MLIRRARRHRGRHQQHVVAADPWRAALPRALRARLGARVAARARAVARSSLRISWSRSSSAFPSIAERGASGGRSASGLALYDLLSAGKSLPSRRVFGRDELLAKMPGLNPEGLVGGASYYDAQVRYPERLVVENVRDAVAHGAVLETYTRVTRVRVERGRAIGVEWQSSAAAAARSAPLIVNAAGPWVDEVLGPIQHTRLIGGTKGSHIVVPPFAGAPRSGVYVEAGADHRPFFILPWNDLLLIGTTDERYEGDPAAATIDARERAYLVSETERVFPGAAGLADARALHAHRRSAAAASSRAVPRAPSRAAISFAAIVPRAGCTRSSAASSRPIARSPRTCCTSCATSCRDRWPRTLTHARPLPGSLAARRPCVVARRAARRSFGERSSAAALAHLRQVRGRCRGARRSARARRAARRQRRADGGARLCAHERVGARRSRTCCSGAAWRGSTADFGLRTAPAAAAALERLGYLGRRRAPRASSRTIASSPRGTARAIRPLMPARVERRQLDLERGQRDLRRDGAQNVAHAGRDFREQRLLARCRLRLRDLGPGSPAKAAEVAKRATVAMAMDRIFMTETPFGCAYTE